MKRFRFSVQAIILLFLIPPSARTQTIARNEKQNPTVNYERLKRIDTLINGYINKHWLTGAVTIIVKDNQLIQYKGYGYQDMDTKKPMSADAIFRF